MGGGRRPKYELALTNEEVRCMFEYLVRDWFEETDGDYNDFVEALLHGNVKEMNIYMNRVALQTFSYFDTGKNPSYEAPCFLQSNPSQVIPGVVAGALFQPPDRDYPVQDTFGIVSGG